MPKNKPYNFPRAVEKAIRDDMLRQVHIDHPELSYAHLGSIFGITRQRVEVIINGIKWGIRRGKD